MPPRVKLWFSFTAPAPVSKTFVCFPTAHLTSAAGVCLWRHKKHNTAHIGLWSPPHACGRECTSTLTSGKGILSLVSSSLAQVNRDDGYKGNSIASSAYSRMLGSRNKCPQLMPFPVPGGLLLAGEPEPRFFVRNCTKAYSTGPLSVSPCTFLPQAATVSLSPFVACSDKLETSSSVARLRPHLVQAGDPIPNIAGEKNRCKPS